jgi:uncharacterized protein YbjT (DUF2867 family)
MQPIAADDVATSVAAVAVGTPVNRIVALAGPEPVTSQVQLQFEIGGPYGKVV